MSDEQAGKEETLTGNLSIKKMGELRMILPEYVPIIHPLLNTVLHWCRLNNLIAQIKRELSCLGDINCKSSSSPNTHLLVCNNPSTPLPLPTPIITHYHTTLSHLRLYIVMIMIMIMMIIIIIMICIYITAGHFIPATWLLPLSCIVIVLYCTALSRGCCFSWIDTRLVCVSF